MSPHAILRPWSIPGSGSAAVMSAYDCASLPVPAVVGAAIDGSSGRAALPKPQ